MQPLARWRLRLTLWYAGIFLSILALLGGGLFLVVRHGMSRHLDASLRAATTAVIHVAHIREAEQARGRGVVADAVDELDIPDRSLYLLDAGGNPIKPAQAAPWIRDAAREASRTGRADRDFESPADHIVRLHAERFTGAAGKVYVAAAVADRLELEDQYASLIESFAAATLVALLLVTGGGYVLVRKSTVPIERSIDQMRRFVADAAHELRTPITILRTRAEVAAGATREPFQDAATFRAIELEAARLGDIVGELLTLARADAGARPIARQVLYLDDAAAGAVDAVRHLAEHKRVVLEVGTFEEAKITGDVMLVRQLLLIVLDNAIKFTPSGGRIRLDVSAENGRAGIVVTDTGIGIPAEQLPHMFERFQHAKTLVRRNSAPAPGGNGWSAGLTSKHGRRPPTFVA